MHLKCVLRHVDELAEYYGSYLNKVRAGDVSPRLRRVLLAGLGVGLPKGVDKIRPVAMPSGTLRFTGRMGMIKSRQAFQRFFLESHPRVKQYAVGVEQGGELMFRFICDTLSTKRDTLAVGVDARAAFQNFDRSSIWDLVDRDFPEIAAEVRFVCISIRGLAEVCHPRRPLCGP